MEEHRKGNKRSTAIRKNEIKYLTDRLVNVVWSNASIHTSQNARVIRLSSSRLGSTGISLLKQ
jgi:hypothetical protein